MYARVEPGSIIHTDESKVYGGMGALFYRHETVNHSEGQYVNGGVTTNGIESVFAVMKRGILGVYHHASAKHLGRYTNEFVFRLNEGNCKVHTMERLASLTDAAVGKRLTYERLIQ